MANSDDQSAGVPKWLGQVCGGIAGGALCWRAGEVAAHRLDEYLAPGDTTSPTPDTGSLLSLHSSSMLIEPALGALGVWAGYTLGGSNPNKGLLILAGMAGGHYLLSEVAEHVREVKHEVASLHEDRTHGTCGDTSLCTSADAHLPASAHLTNHFPATLEQSRNWLDIDPVQFSGWEKGGSGYWYEYDPDGNYTGNWSA